mmetsp:Transcript_20352/g.53417  ORF Transcript_20352/g.53417 Transcript_20352/m.53417 type:complete len:200 (-) Transcript_20352:448-1047(-)
MLASCTTTFEEAPASTVNSVVRRPAGASSSSQQDEIDPQDDDRLRFALYATAVDVLALTAAAPDVLALTTPALYATALGAPASTVSAPVVVPGRRRTRTSSSPSQHVATAHCWLSQQKQGRMHPQGNTHPLPPAPAQQNGRHSKQHSRHSSRMTRMMNSISSHGGTPISALLLRSHAPPEARLALPNIPQPTVQPWRQQ